LKNFRITYVVGNPAGKMNKLITLLTFILLSCSTADKYDLFNIDKADNFEFIDFEKINDIRTFNKEFWYADSLNDDFGFIAKFDFEKGDFSNTSAKGIKLEGLPFSCLELDCNRRYGQKLYLSDTYEVLGDDNGVLNDEQIKELVRINILNFGEDPSLSDEPREAVTEIYLKPEHRINKLGHILKVIADSYIDIIESKRVETNWTTDKLICEYPFGLHLRQNMIPDNLPKTIVVPTDEEIEGEIYIDSIALKMK
jgi:hypothetical protein